MEFKHDSYPGTSLEWRGFNPWAESFRRYQKNPKLCVGDLSVTLCVVSLLRGLKVGKEIETLAQDGWSFLGNLWDNSQCQLESLPCKKDCKSQFIEWQKKFPSRNWHTHRDGKIFWPWWLDVHLGLNLSFPFFFLIYAYGQGNAGCNFGRDGLPVCRGKGHRGLDLPRAWVIPTDPLSEHKKFRRNRGKEKAKSEISLEISSQLTEIAASGVSQLRDDINISNCPWWVYLSPNCCSNPYRQMQYPVVMSSTFQKWALWRITSLGSFW